MIIKIQEEKQSVKMRLLTLSILSFLKNQNKEKRIRVIEKSQSLLIKGKDLNRLKTFLTSNHVNFTIIQ